MKSEKIDYNHSLKLAKQDLFEKLYKKVLMALNEAGFDTDLNKLKKDNPQLSYDIDQADDRLNEVWKAGLKGEATIEEFKKALYEWYSLMQKAI